MTGQQHWPMLKLLILTLFLLTSVGYADQYKYNPYTGKLDNIGTPANLTNVLTKDGNTVGATNNQQTFNNGIISNGDVNFASLLTFKKESLATIVVNPSEASAANGGDLNLTAGDGGLLSNGGNIILNSGNGGGRSGGGAIASLSFSSYPGTGYSANDILTLNSASNDATVTVTSVDGSGAITGFSITNSGTNYTVTPGVSVSGGTGSGASPAILSVIPLNTSAGNVVINFGLKSGTGLPGSFQVQNGNVGIGTTSPSSSLDVVGSVRMSIATESIQNGGGGI